MWTDIVDLHDFYSSRLGRRVQRTLTARLQRHWPSLRNDTVVGLGYAVPFLEPLRGEAARVIALMPAAQGVMRWPADGGPGGLVALTDETDLPLPDRSVDRLLLVHALEAAEHVRALLREIWRVLSDRGRLLVVVPNRHGLWCHFDHTPFGQGQPYTRDQVIRLLRDNMFMPTDSAGALYLPPISAPWAQRLSGPAERLGDHCCGALAGVWMIEAAKQIYAAGAIGQGERRRSLSFLPGRLGSSGTSQRRDPLPPVVRDDDGDLPPAPV